MTQNALTALHWPMTVPRTKSITESFNQVFSYIMDTIKVTVTV